MERCRWCGDEIALDEVGQWYHANDNHTFYYSCGNDDDFDVEPVPKKQVLKEYFYGREQRS
jgi:hypothetical protein